MENDYSKIYEYLYTHVRQIYKSFDGGHNENHFDEVVKAADELANRLSMSERDRLLVNIAAAYHDVGRMIDDRRHEEYSVIIFNNDFNMKRWLNQDEMQLVSNTINEHRSNKGASTVFSKILKDADKAYSITNRERWIVRIVRGIMDHSNIPVNNPAFSLFVISEKCLTKLNKVYKTNDWKLPESKELFGSIPVHEVPTASEVEKYILDYINELEA